MTWMQFGHHAYEIGSATAPRGVRPREIADALSRINRYTGHTVCPYSVAQHSVFVSKLLDWNTEAAMHGLLHDVAETVVNDVSQPVKAHMSDRWHEEWRRIEDAATEALYGVCQVPYPVPPRIQKWIKRADWIAAATEKRDLMPDCDRSWDMLQEPPHHDYLCAIEQPEKAAAEWLDRYVELANHLSIRL